MNPLSAVRAAAAASGATALTWLATASRRHFVRVNALGYRLNWTRHNLRYRGGPDDIFVATYPKSGTTLVQMLMYQLSTDGNLDLEHISSFSPFLDEIIITRNPDRTLDSLPPPHVFKSHLSYELTPKGPGRYIYVMRNGLDVALSFYHQRLQTGFRGSFEDFFDWFMQDDPLIGSWFDHVAGWLRNESGLNVMYLTYEELIRDFEPAARRLAAFCGITVPEPEWPRILERCSFSFMRDHEKKLVPSPRTFELVQGAGPDANGNGAASLLTPDVVARFDAKLTWALRRARSVSREGIRVHGQSDTVSTGASL